MEGPLKIAISSIGRFHMFDLARQMVRLGQGVRLYTGYPRWKVDSNLRSMADTRPWWVVAEHVRRKLPFPQRTTWWTDQALGDFGLWLARKIGEVDILDALAGTGLEAGRLLHEQGKPWICNRGSTHILTQKRLLEEEHARWQAPPPYFSKAGLERCLVEYHEADAIVVPSEFARRSFLEQGIAPDRVFTCVFGVDPSMFHPSWPSRPHQRFRVVSAGGCSIQKGIGDLLEAVRPLAKRGLVETWLLGGIAPEARPILALHQGEFVYQGTQPRRQLAQVLSQCDVMVLPSIQEGLALVLAQAMACGVPVIATPNTGAQDLFTDGVEGFIVPVRDPEAIREKLLWMLDNPLKRQAMGAAALKRVRDLGGWDTYGSRALAIYRELLARQRCLV